MWLFRDSLLEPNEKCVGEANTKGTEISYKLSRTMPAEKMERARK